MRIKRKHRLAGQAMVEFAVALVVIMVLFVGFIQINSMIKARTETMMSARAEAGQKAMAHNYGETMSAMYILNWWYGPDGKMYTADDQPFPASDSSDAVLSIAETLRPADLSAFIPDHSFSGLEETGSIIDEFFLVRGYAHDSVPVFPAVRNLIYGSPNISVESRAWLVWTKGIY